MFNKIETYTFNEYRNVIDTRELYILDSQIGILKKTDMINYRKLVVMVALFVLSSTIPIFANTNAFDPAGNAIFDLLVSIAKWVFIAKGGWEIIQNISMGCNIGDISSVLTKYGMGYGAIIMLPKLLTMLGTAIGKISI